MINISSDALVEESKRSSRRGFRFSLTAEKNGHYVSLEMPLSELHKHLEFIDAGGNSNTLNVTYLPAQLAADNGMVNLRHVVVRLGAEGDDRPRMRGAASRAVRLYTLSHSRLPDAEAVQAAREEISKDVEPIVGLVDNKTALFIPIPVVIVK